MKTLGSIIFFLLLIIPNILNAAVVAKVDAQTISVGEVVTLNLVIKGEDIQKPSLTELCGYDVISSSSQTSIQMVNMDYQKTYTLSYQFVPQKSCTIESIALEIDSQIEKTEPIKIEVKPYVQDVNADFQLSLIADKKDVYIGEPFDLTLLFKQKKSVEAVDSKFIAPELKALWMKGETQPTRYSEGSYTITKLTYKLAPQREGALTISPAQMRIASRSHTRDNWGSFIPNVKWKSYFSNELNLNVKPLPSGVNLVGKFTIKASVEKTDVNANEAVSVTIEVLGDGNLEDIKSFKPYIDGVSVFDEKIVVQGNKLTQKIAFVADEDFVIPSFSLEYFDLKTKEVKRIQTKEIAIKVKGTKVKEKLVIQKSQPREPETKEIIISSDGFSLVYLILVAFGSFILGIVVMALKPWSIFKHEKKFSSKDPKQLLIKLLPYKEDKEVQKIVVALEQHLYENKSLNIDKKTIKEMIYKYNLNYSTFAHKT